MPFPGSKSIPLQFADPILVTANRTVVVPEKATMMLAYIVGGGASGCAASSAASAVNGAGGGGGAAAGTLIKVDLEAWRWQSTLPLKTASLLIDVTVGAGGTAVGYNSASSGSTAGNPGGITTLALTGGLSVAVNGGSGGTRSGQNGQGGNGGSLATANQFNKSYSHFDSAVMVRSLVAVPVAVGVSTYQGDVGGAGGDSLSTVGSESANAGTAGASIVFPWWLQAVGITSSTVGAGAFITSSGKAAGGGGSSAIGSGGNAAVSNTAGAVTAGSGSGYGSGGGGAAGINSSAITSGAGAPGCAVIVFQVEV